MSFDITTLLLGLLFGCVGWGAWRYGKQTSSARHMLLGAALMGYAYLVPDVWLNLIIGTALTGFLFWP